MTRPTYVKQPGPVADERIVAVATHGRSFSLTLAAGKRLVDAIAAGFAVHRFVSGTVELSGLALGPFAYVTPALSKTGENAAFYSDTFHPAGLSRIKHGALTFGRRDGAPFFHAHALWTEADGKFSGGHIMPDETVVAEPLTVSAYGVIDAAFEGHLDPETNFKLLGPIQHHVSGGFAHWTLAHAIRFRPNQDFTGALEAFCVAHGIKRARVHGGVGSTIGAAFDDGRIVENFATEVYIQRGVIEPGADGQPVALIDVGLVDYTGATAEGRLARGQNPVLMTFELMIEVVGRESQTSSSDGGGVLVGCTG
jgi:predicted DNA-binding protein with PD1-like motif